MLRNSPRPQGQQKGGCTSKLCDLGVRVLCDAQPWTSPASPKADSLSSGQVGERSRLETHVPKNTLTIAVNTGFGDLGKIFLAGVNLQMTEWLVF